MPKDRRTRDQKRRAKLAKRKQELREFESLAYNGKKYKTEELTPDWLQTEIGIYESFVISDRKLLDQTVANAIEMLVNRMRAGKLPPIADSDVLDYDAGQAEEFVIACIRRRWALHFETEWRPRKDQLIGVLRSVLATLELKQSPSPQSQDYLRYIAKFLTKELGISMQRIPADAVSAAGME